MRLNINLASQKYEAVRQFYVRWSTAIGLAALLAVLLMGLAVINSFSSSMSSQRIKELKRQVAFLEKQRAAAEAVSNLPENHDVNAQKNYWNKQINRRQLSWTQLFNDLQRIMPARSYLSSVRPEITPDNQLKLTLTIMGDTHDNALELEKKMEKSERFRGPFINGEGSVKDQKSGAQIWKFDIVTYYAAAGAGQGRAPSKEGL